MKAGKILCLFVLLTACTIVEKGVNPLPDVIDPPLQLTEMPEEAMFSCNRYCSTLEGVTSIRVTYETEFNCSCLGDGGIISNAIVEKQNVPDDFGGSIAHWGHMPVTYKVLEGCGDYETRKVRRAFSELANVSEVSFLEVESGEDITLYCTYLDGCYDHTVEIEETYTRYAESICQHDRGRALITDRFGSLLLSAEIEMIGLGGFSETTGKGMSGFYVGTCGNTNTEKHEILHTFGFDHVNDSASLMYYQSESSGYVLGKSCEGSKKDVDFEIIRTLNEVYSSS